MMELLMFNLIARLKARIWSRGVERKKKELEGDLLRASRFLKRIDSKLIAMKYTRQQRRQFWRDFQKNDMFREDVFEGLIVRKDK